MTIHAPITPIAQGGIDDLGARMTGIATQAMTVIIGLAVLAATIWVLIQTITALYKSPSFGKLAGIAGVALFAAFLIGAMPAMVAAAYDFGRDFWADGGGIDPAGVQVDVTVPAAPAGEEVPS
jgi:hypothetical protein